MASSMCKNKTRATKTNPKIRISDFYDSLVNGVDVFVEQLLEKHDKDDKLFHPIDTSNEEEEETRPQDEESLETT